MTSGGPLRHPNCAGQESHPWKSPARPGPLTPDQCLLCHMALNEPERVRALIAGRPAALKAAEPARPGRWPWWAWLISWLRWRGDYGVGDTVDRRLRQLFIGRVWKWWQTDGCSACQGKQARWNRHYPYAPDGRGWPV